MIKAIRVFYNKSTTAVVWSHTLEGIGSFPTTIDQDLIKIPDKKPDGKTPLGGVVEDYGGIEVIDPVLIDGFLKSDVNTVVNGELIIGAERVSPLPVPPKSVHISVLVAVNPTKAKPVRIKRTWHGNEYFYDCFATQTVKDEFIAGKIIIGDYVIVLFDEDTREQVVQAKVWKSW